MSVPSALAKDSTIAPFITRALELEAVNPVVSYYCKIYVLEQILSRKLHSQDKQIEAYTIQLLDETEAVKTLTDPDDESLVKVLGDKNLSFSAVLLFAYSVVNSSLQDLLVYDGTNKQQLAGKFRAAINFLTILSIFYSKDDSAIDYARFAGPKVESAAAFAQLNKDKIKSLKYNLAQLLKDQVPIQGENLDKELEAELDKELEEIGRKTSDIDLGKRTTTEVEPEGLDANNKVEDNLTGNEKSSEVEFEGFDESVNHSASYASQHALPDFIDSDTPVLPGVPNNEPLLSEVIDNASLTSNDAPFSLPGVPRFSPESKDNGLGLPGTPSFLPDSDISHINKHSSIHVIPPEKKESNLLSAPPSVPKPTRKASVQHETKPSDITEILSTADAVTKIQKHAKFAISALNYEDFKTAERELLAGLEVLRAAQEGERV